MYASHQDLVFTRTPRSCRLLLACRLLSLLLHTETRWLRKQLLHVWQMQKHCCRNTRWELKTYNSGITQCTIHMRNTARRKENNDNLVQCTAQTIWHLMGIWRGKNFLSMKQFTHSSEISKKYVWQIGSHTKSESNSRTIFVESSFLTSIHAHVSPSFNSSKILLICLLAQSNRENYDTAYDEGRKEQKI